MGRIFVGSLLLVLAYFPCALLGNLLVLSPLPQLPLHPGLGLGVAVLALRGFAYAPGLLVADFAINLALGAASVEQTALGAGARLMVAAGAALVARRYLGGHGDLLLGLALLRLLLWVVLASGLLGALLFWPGGLLPPLHGAGVAGGFLFHGAASAFGVLAVFPLAFLVLERRDPLRFPNRMLLAGVYLGSLLIVIAVYVNDRDAGRLRVEAELAAIAEQAASRLSNNLVSYVVALRAIEALFASSDSVSREEFDRFSSSLQKPLPGLYAVAWDAFVPHAEREAFVARMRATGLPDFEIFEVDAEGQRRVAPERPYYVPVAYARYEGDPLKALGFDMASEPTRKAALDQALRTGLPTASGRVKLVTDADPGYDILILMTMRGGADDALIGYSGLAVHASELFRVALGDLERHLLARLYDRSAPPETAWLHGAPEDLVPPAGSLRVARPIEVATREWELELIALPGYLVAHFPTRSLILLWGGVLLSLMAAVLLLDTAAGRS